MVLEYSDQDGDGYLETENVQSAQGGSAVINFWKNSADVNHDGTFDIIEVQRNPEKFNKRLLEDKVDFFSSKEKTVRKNRIVLSCLSMNDM